MADHLCAAEGCTRNVSREKLLCIAHWRRVPYRLRVALYHYWNGGAVRQGYFETRDKVIAAVMISEERAGRVRQ